MTTADAAAGATAAAADAFEVGDYGAITTTILARSGGGGNSGNGGGRAGQAGWLRAARSRSGVSLGLLAIGAAASLLIIGKRR